ncbi:hypothetical protein DFJ63DRAFT_125695 [Scheffersomyces coipomensis]|uniref:uncharacterized protein n=1 Tax=Scheffersomyces coipomensis TaxID=1788519 RepID=UPI00315DA46B
MSRKLRSSQTSSSQESDLSSINDTNLVTIQRENIPSLKVSIKLQPSILKFISLKNEFDSLVRSSQTPTDLRDIDLQKYDHSNLTPKTINVNNNKNEDLGNDYDDSDDDTVVIHNQNSIPKISKDIDEEEADEISEDPFSSDDEMYLMESQINKALSSKVSLSTPSTDPKPIATSTQSTTKIPSQLPSSPVKKPVSQGPELSGYKPVPSNIAPILQYELNKLNSFDDATQSQNPDEIMVAEKLIFSLKDPLSATKIKLPVKSSSCIHFECFDFETFCLFNKISSQVQSVLKHDLSRKNFLMKKEQSNLNKNKINTTPTTNTNTTTSNTPLQLPTPPQVQRQHHPVPPNRGQSQNNNQFNYNNNINFNNNNNIDYVRVIENPMPQYLPFITTNTFESYSTRVNHPPNTVYPYYHPVPPPPPPPPHKPFKCPLCDTKFSLPELSISDSYNYFVKSTPKDTERIELFEMRLYRILDDSNSNSYSKRGSSEVVEEEIIILSDDDDDQEEAQVTPSKSKHKSSSKSKTNKNQDYVKTERRQPQEFNEDIPLKDLYTQSFNELDDGLDDELLSIGIFTAYRPNLSAKKSDNYSSGKGEGSFDDPVTLD